MAMKLEVARTAPATATEAKPESQLWMNPGIFEEINGVRTFVGLGTGIALDTMKDVPIRGSNEAFRKLCGAKNDLRDALIALCESLEPGQDEILEGLVIQIRRRKTVEEEVTTEEGVVTTLNKLSFAKAS